MSPVVVAALLVAVALAFLPMDRLPSFDVPKLALLVAAAAGLCLWTARRRGRDEREGALVDPLLLLPLLAAGVACVGALLAWPRGSLVGPTTAVACVAVARLAAQSPAPRNAVRTVARGVAVAAAVAGAYALLQRAGGDFTPWAARRDVVATFGNPSFAAEFQAAALPFTLFLALHPDSRRADGLLGAAAALLALAHLALAMSRTDVVAAAAGLLVAACLVLVGRGRPRAAAALGAAGLVAGAAVGVAFLAAARGDGPSWLGRSDTMAVRMGVWRATARMVAHAPLRVAGTPFVDVFPDWREPDEYRISLGRRVDTAHDDYLEIAAALGVPGLLLALAVVGLVAKRLVAAARTDAAEAATLGGSLAALSVSALASSPLTHTATALLPAVAVGLLVGLAPRPLRRGPRTLRVDMAFAAALLLALFAGPALSNLRSDGFLALGRQEFAKGDVQRALVLLDRAAEIDPQAFDARFELGSLLTAAGQPQAAIETLNAASELRPGDLEARIGTAYALRDAGRRPEADVVVDEALRRCPWHPFLLGARAIFALEDDRVADAVDAAERAVAGLPGERRLVALAAEAHLAASPGERSYEECLDALSRLADAKETEDLGRSARSMLRRDRGLLGPLVTRARRLAHERPDEAAALVLAAAGAVNDDAGFLDDASKILRDAGSPEPSRTLLGRSLGVLAAQALARDENARAQKLAVQAVERDPSSAHYLLAARASTRLGDRKAAVEDVGWALAQGSVDPDEIRRDPILSTLLPDPRLSAILERAAERRDGRSGENHGRAGRR